MHTLQILYVVERKKDDGEAKGGDIQNSGKDSISVWGRDIVNNEKPRKENEVNEMRMLRWIMKNYIMRNQHVRGSVKVEPMTKKITEKRLKWSDKLREVTKGTY